MERTERIDVVCQRPVEESIALASGLTLEHENHLYYFCCESCLNHFRHEPQKYTGRLDVQYGAQPSTGEMTMP